MPADVIGEIVRSPAFDATRAPYVVLDKDMRVRAANPAYERLTAQPREGLIGQLLFEVFPGNPTDPNGDAGPRLSASVEHVLRQGVRDYIGVQRHDSPDPRNPGRYQHRFWASVNSPLRDDRGKIMAVLVHAEDVTFAFSPTPVPERTISAPSDPADERWAAVLSALEMEHARGERLGRQLATLREALATNRRISVAIGLIMASTPLDEDAAFDLLRSASQTSGRKLRDVADDVVRDHKRHPLEPRQRQNGSR